MQKYPTFHGKDLSNVHNFTLPKTNSSPLKIGLPKKKLVLRIPNIHFQVRTVCFREGISNFTPRFFVPRQETYSPKACAVVVRRRKSSLVPKRWSNKVKSNLGDLEASANWTSDSFPYSLPNTMWVKPLWKFIYPCFFSQTKSCPPKHMWSTLFVAKTAVALGDSRTRIRPVHPLPKISHTKNGHI